MVKMSDIAAHLGVSRLTVSAVLNNRTGEVGISEETARRVREAALELGYHRNHLAIAMKTGVNPVIGCFISDLTAEWTGRTLSGLLRAMHQSGYLTKIEEVYGEKAERAALARFMEQRIAGIFCCNLNSGESFARTLEEMTRRYETPIVCSTSRADLAAHKVNSDDILGIGLAVDHLWQLGHRRIAFLGGEFIGEPRRVGFLHAMRERGGEVPPENLAITGREFRRVEVVMTEWMTRKRRRPTAVVCVSDSLAAVAMRTARSHGISIPGKLSVIGFSNSALCEVTDPPLTSVAQPFEAIGHRCGTLLMELIERRKKKATPAFRDEQLATSLALRASCGPVRR